MRKKISLVTPVYNEEENVEIFYKAASELIDTLKDRYDFEFVFTDNHSEDRTWTILESIAEKDPRVHIIRFSRNFGYQKSILTGYLNSKGDAAIQLDCDLQDPLELIPEFLNLWEHGYQVVYGIRKNREEGFLLHAFRKLYYRLIRKISDINIPVDAGDFRLVDRRILDEIHLVKDESPYLRGIIAEMGFRQVGIPYDRRARIRGKSKFRWADLWVLGVDGVLNHSILPLKILFYFGVFIFFLTLGAVVLVLVSHWLVGSQWPRGFTTIVLIQLFSLSITTLFLGVLGAYVGRIFNQSKSKPLTIIETRKP